MTDFYGLLIVQRQAREGFTFLLTTLDRLIGTYAEHGITVAFAGMKGPVRDLAERAGWTEKYGRLISFLTLEQAVRELAENRAGTHP